MKYINRTLTLTLLSMSCLPLLTLANNALEPGFDRIDEGVFESDIERKLEELCQVIDAAPQMRGRIFEARGRGKSKGTTVADKIERLKDLCSDKLPKELAKLREGRAIITTSGYYTKAKDNINNSKVAFDRYGNACNSDSRSMVTYDRTADLDYGLEHAISTDLANAKSLLERTLLETRSMIPTVQEKRASYRRWLTGYLQTLDEFTQRINGGEDLNYDNIRRDHQDNFRMFSLWLTQAELDTLDDRWDSLTRSATAHGLVTTTPTPTATVTPNPIEEAPAEAPNNGLEACLARCRASAMYRSICDDNCYTNHRH